MFVQRLRHFLSLIVLSFGFPAAVNGEALCPLSVPLVACDPYFSIWSSADKLTDVDTTRRTGKPQRLTSLVRIDRKPFRLMGTEPANVPALPQSGLEVLPTRTIYTFETNSPVRGSRGSIPFSVNLC